MKATSIEGNRQWLDGGAMFGNAPKTMWSAWVKSDEKNRIPLACRSLLIDTGKVKVLFELGVGLFFEPSLRERYGIEGSENMLFKNLQEMGVSEEDIDYVVPSHLHFDHVGGLVPDWPATQNENWELRFPRAKYIVGKVQFEHSCKPHKRDRASYIVGLADKLQKSGRMILIDGETTSEQHLNGWLSFHFADGHTPSLMHAIIKGKNTSLFFASDMIPGLSWVHTAISMGYDRFAEKCLDEKEVLLKKAIQENWILFYTHDEKYAASYVEVNEKGKYQGAKPMVNLVNFSF
jgi:glyoxylase-like metal-dependent hydrolase (beta-lactamase superfamily II)